MRFVVLALAIISSGAGCASAVRTIPYHAPSLTVPAVKPALYDAITELARAQGWEIVVVEPTRGLVEAVTPSEMILGMGMRERWCFDIRDYEVGVTRYLEVQFDREGGDWMRESAVSSGYGYKREREVLASLGRHFGASIQSFQ